MAGMATFISTWPRPRRGQRRRNANVSSALDATTSPSPSPGPTSPLRPYARAAVARPLSGRFSAVVVEVENASGSSSSASSSSSGWLAGDDAKVEQSDSHAREPPESCARSLAGCGHKSWLSRRRPGPARVVGSPSRARLSWWLARSRGAGVACARHLHLPSRRLHSQS